MLNQEQIEALVAECTHDIEEQARQRIKTSVAEEVNRAVQHQIRKAADEYLEKHVQPKIVSALAEHDNAIVSGAVQVANMAGTYLATAMMEDFKEKMSRSWERKKILEAMFG